MYICKNCGNIFPEEEAQEFHTTKEALYGVYDLFKTHTPTTLYLCPECDSDDLIEAKECKECGEFVHPDDYDNWDEICLKCLEKREDE